MYDLHTHTFLSDGELCAAELVRRYASSGYKGVVITDHVDASTLDSIVPQIVSFVKETQPFMPDIDVLAGCELTHVPPRMIKQLVARARSLGARFVVVHGETIVEPVAKGTNRFAIEAGADLLAHPGLISEEDVQIAAEKGVALEITSRAGHSYTNGFVLRLARKCGATLVYSSDFHQVQNLLSLEMVTAVIQGTGAELRELDEILENTKKLFFSRK
jgi:putative hydrolase